PPVDRPDPPTRASAGRQGDGPHPDRDPQRPDDRRAGRRLAQHQGEADEAAPRRRRARPDRHERRPAIRCPRHARRSRRPPHVPPRRRVVVPLRVTSAWLTGVRVRRLAVALKALPGAPPGLPVVEARTVAWRACGGPFAEIEALLSVLRDLDLVAVTGDSIR